jgi:hypothetical protein
MSTLGLCLSFRKTSDRCLKYNTEDESVDGEGMVDDDGFQTKVDDEETYKDFP